MSEDVKAVAAIIGLMVVLPIILLVARDRLFGTGSRSPEAFQGTRPDLEQLLNPDWSFYERYLQRPVPSELRELYADQDMITWTDFDYGDAESVNCFEPIDEKCALDTKEFVGFDIVPIATSFCGDPLYLQPGPMEADKVYITHHDGGDTAVVASSVGAFVATLRRTRGNG